MNSPNYNVVKNIALKILIGLPLAGLIWTIIFRFFGSNELWNWDILIVFASIGAVLGLGSLAYYPFEFHYRFWNQLIGLIDLLIVILSPAFLLHNLNSLFFCYPYLGKSKLSLENTKLAAIGKM